MPILVSTEGVVGQSLDLLVVGAGGLLGSALVRFGDRHGHVEVISGVPWESADAPRYLAQRVSEYVDRQPGGSVAWCAGRSIIGATDALLDQETECLAACLDACQADGVSVLYASSAGGVYGTAAQVPITEDSPPAPLSAYGRHKLAQEALVRGWAHSCGGRAALARLTNLYGPGHRLDKGQGLVTQAVMATLTRRPLPVYVPLDTMRDYLHVDDAAGVLSAMSRRLRGVGSGGVVTKIVGSGQSTSIGAVLSTVGTVVGRRPTVAQSRSALRQQQGSVLAFRSEVWPDLDRERRTLASGIDTVVHDVRVRLAEARHL